MMHNKLGDAADKSTTQKRLATVGQDNERWIFSLGYSTNRFSWLLLVFNELSYVFNLEIQMTKKQSSFLGTFNLSLLHSVLPSVNKGSQQIYFSGVSETALSRRRRVVCETEGKYFAVQTVLSSGKLYYSDKETKEKQTKILSCFEKKITFPSDEGRGFAGNVRPVLSFMSISAVYKPNVTFSNRISKRGVAVRGAKTLGTRLIITQYFFISLFRLVLIVF